ncbi:plasmid mobilization protein [Streptomyces sp. NPDC001739]
MTDGSYRRNAPADTPANNSSSGRASWSFGYSPGGGVSKTASAPGVAEPDRHQGTPVEEAAERGPQPQGDTPHACHAVHCEHSTPAKPRVRRRTRQPRQRDRIRTVRLTQQELDTISAGAKAAGLTVAGFLSHSALAAARDLDASAAQVAGERQLVAEFFAARRHLAQVGNNLNQVAKTLNSGGEAPQAEAVLDVVRRATLRVQEAVTRLIGQHGGAA